MRAQPRARNSGANSSIGWRFPWNKHQNGYRSCCSSRVLCCACLAIGAVMPTLIRKRARIRIARAIPPAAVGEATHRTDDREDAETAAWSAPGVSRIENRLQIR